MKVTDLTPQKNNKLRVNVFIDGKYRFSLDAADAALKGIKIGSELNDGEIKSFALDSSYTKARDYALNVISVKSITKKLLNEKLLKKGYDELVCDEVLKELEELGYIDDYAYGEMYLEYCLEKFWGKRKIQYEMNIKGIPQSIASKLLETLDEDDTVNSIVEVIRAKYSGCDLKDVKIKAKITRYFASRGFDFSKIDTAINTALRESEHE